MNTLRILLVAMSLAILGYTAVVVMTHGWGLLDVYLTQVQALNWPGQFNVDFSFYLMLSALWVAWRHQFSPTGLALGAVASVGGMAFFGPYVLFLTFKHHDVRGLLLGAQA
ncbi:MAG: hypothetical protein R3E66_22710 [bacterium]